MGAASGHECCPAAAATEDHAAFQDKHVNRKVSLDGGEGLPSTEAAVTPRHPASPSLPANALGLTPQEVADVRRVHGLLARDATAHCVRMHIKYFRRFPRHLERFCGREALPEPLHYSPAQLGRDSDFTARALMHGLAQLQALRCSTAGDADAMTAHLANIAMAHRGLGLTRDCFRKYRDVMLAYLEEALPQAQPQAQPQVAPSSPGPGSPSSPGSPGQSCGAFLTILCDGLADALELLHQQDRHAPSLARRIALTSSWVECQAPQGWPLVVYYAGGRRACPGGRRSRNTAGTNACSNCNQPGCTCKWDVRHEGKPWRNDSDTFPSLLEDDENENESPAESEGERSQCASETFPIGMSASHFAPA